MSSTTGGDLENLRITMQILGGLRFDKELLTRLFARTNVMIESPILQEWLAEQDVKTRQAVILESLEARFGPIPPDVSAAIRVVQNETRLKQLLQFAYTSTTLDAFRESLAHSTAN